MSEYPANVCVHGNGFVQISLGGMPETRIHIWHKDLPDCQHVNTQVHDHRFGFVSTVLRGVQVNNLIETFFCFLPENVDQEWEKWTAAPGRLITGNRPLVKQPGTFGLQSVGESEYHPGEAYNMVPRVYHVTKPGAPITVTLMTKTHIIPEEEFQASVLCRKGQEPDQEFDRFQVPWLELRDIMTDALDETPFKGLQPWRM